MGRYFRSPSTLGSMRASDAVCPEEGEPYFRGKRTKRNLPTNYSDICRDFSKTWKRHRKAQCRLLS